MTDEQRPKDAPPEVTPPNSPASRFIGPQGSMRVVKRAQVRTGDQSEDGILTTATGEWRPGDPFDVDRTPIVGFLDGHDGPTTLYADDTRIHYPREGDPVTIDAKDETNSDSAYR
jgi:hypothetical protein